MTNKQPDGALERKSAMTQLVLSLFPGIGLLDLAFEEEGFTVVRGPDLLWGGDIKCFHPPAGKFDGVIGGPPCQAFSPLRHVVRLHNPDYDPPNLIPEFERIVSEAKPRWFLMENVPQASVPSVGGYIVRDELIRDVWVGGETSRLRRFSFGTRKGMRLQIETLALHRPDPERAILGGGANRPRVAGSPEKSLGKRFTLSNEGYKTRWAFEAMKRLSGLPSEYDLPPFTVAAKVKALGNGVPLPMGRAVARAIRRALDNALKEG